MKKCVTVSRETLYQQVWETPVSKLAKHYGISDRGLSKICKRLKIPTPGRGYWARKAAGKNVIQYQFPDLDENTPQEVLIAEYDGITNPEIQASIAASLQDNLEIKVPERLANTHPVIKSWLEEYQRRRRDNNRFFRTEPLTAIQRRCHRILNVLFKELEKQSYAIKSEHYEQAYLEYLGSRVEFVLREKQKRVRRPLTKKEKTDYFYRDKPWVQELQPTGMLLFSIKTWMPKQGLRREWLETEKKSMESLLPEILATLKVAGPLWVEQARLREEERRRNEEAQHQRYLLEQALKRERKQWQLFLDFAGDWKKAELARQFIAEIEQRINKEEEYQVGDKTLTAWMDWARECADKMDPSRQTPDELFAQIASITEWS